MTRHLLPLGATAPSDAVSFMKVDRNATMVAEVEEFINELRKLMDAAENSSGDTARVATVYDINMQSVKKMSSADPRGRGVADGQVVVRKTGGAARERQVRLEAQQRRGAEIKLTMTRSISTSSTKRHAWCISAASGRNILGACSTSRDTSDDPVSREGGHLSGPRGSDLSVHQR